MSFLIDRTRLLAAAVLLLLSLSFDRLHTDTDLRRGPDEPAGADRGAGTNPRCPCAGIRRNGAASRNIRKTGSIVLPLFFMTSTGTASRRRLSSYQSASKGDATWINILDQVEGEWISSL